MTSEQVSLSPASRDDGGAPLRGFEFAACGVLQLSQRVGAEVRQGMALEPSPEVFDRIEFGRVWGQERELNMALGRVDVVAHETAAVRAATIPQDEQPPTIMRFERLEKLNDLLLFDRAIVKTKAHSGEVHTGDDRDVIPVEAELHHRAFALQRPGAHSRGALRQARFVDEDDQPSLSPGFFLSPGHVRFFQCSIATSSRSRARRSGF